VLELGDLCGSQPVAGKTGAQSQPNRDSTLRDSMAGFETIIIRFGTSLPDATEALGTNPLVNAPLQRPVGSVGRVPLFAR
jgi:hypothetical protein